MLPEGDEHEACRRRSDQVELRQAPVRLLAATGEPNVNEAPQEPNSTAVLTSQEQWLVDRFRSLGPDDQAVLLHVAEWGSRFTNWLVKNAPPAPGETAAPAG